jgi:hypothetical protein
MPYIKQNMRELSAFKKLRAFPRLTAGELNYAITQLLLSQEPSCYDDYNTIMGVLESVKHELYRKRISIYEDIKCEENGEVYD